MAETTRKRESVYEIDLVGSEVPQKITLVMRHVVMK